ncbi:Target of rapamycin complex 2 subunit avo2 [Elasticomyces elasticus]|nr:Target of rapamycin complex 2 subunit avo2 [Elasticomyces elasticus]KAK3660213.1 Target of rapamycin complex 2 subunit avo2 [Elasticomyces elasticus]KAK4933715.1 Target of rapamycin complex 2 subunit avo2 [Elasticomyces elasticus]KAK5761595.1 Target of rapamycin complex 2 subunit avo2 [Elasticomyces elasticus]
MVSKTGLDALAMASQHPASNGLIQVLLSNAEYPASPHIKDQDGNTPLHHASASGSLKALRILLSAGANPLAKNNYDWTPLAYSQTVAAEVYFKNLVAEFERRKVEGAKQGEEREKQRAAGVRIVDDNDVSGKPRLSTEDEMIGDALKRHWSPVDRRRPMTPSSAPRHEWGLGLSHVQAVSALRGTFRLVNALVSGKLDINTNVVTQAPQPPTMQLPQDPRFEGTSEYDRDEVCKVFLDFYNFLASMPPYEPSDVLVPPEHGWPSVTPEKMSTLKKNHTVVDLLKHLPYLNMDKRNDKDGKFEYTILYDAELLDYRGRIFDEAVQANFQPFYGPGYVPPHGSFPPWIVPFAAFTSRNGEFGLLDTTDGTITRHLNAGCSYDPTYAKDDPRSWRDECEDETHPAAAYFEKWRGSFQRSEWLPCWMRNEFTLIFDNQGEKYEQVRDIYPGHGWPGTFRREECGQALRGWDRQAHPKHLKE